MNLSAKHPRTPQDGSQEPKLQALTGGFFLPSLRPMAMGCPCVPLVAVGPTWLAYQVTKLLGHPQGLEEDCSEGHRTSEWPNPPNTALMAEPKPESGQPWGWGDSGPSKQQPVGIPHFMPSL